MSFHLLRRHAVIDYRRLIPIVDRSCATATAGRIQRSGDGMNLEQLVGDGSQGLSITCASAPDFFSSHSPERNLP
jgi:hypothetical protein